MIPPTVCEVKCAATQALIALIEEPLPAVCAAALEPAVTERIPAGHFGLMSAGGVFFGMNQKSKRRFVVSVTSGGGWGGRGWSWEATTGSS